MSKLIAERGTIKKVSEWSAGTLQVSFKNAAITPAGDLGQATISDGEGEVNLTYAQAIALANEILRRCQR